MSVHTGQPGRISSLRRTLCQETNRQRRGARRNPPGDSRADSPHRPENGAAEGSWGQGFCSLSDEGADFVAHPLVVHGAITTTSQGGFMKRILLSSLVVALLVPAAQAT